MWIFHIQLGIVNKFVVFFELQSFVSPGQVSMHASNVLQWRKKKKDQYLAKTAEVFFEEYYTKNPLNKDGMTEEEWKQRQTRREQAKSRRK